MWTFDTAVAEYTKLKTGFIWIFIAIKQKRWRPRISKISLILIYIRLMDIYLNLLSYLTYIVMYILVGWYTSITAIPKCCVHKTDFEFEITTIICNTNILFLSLSTLLLIFYATILPRRYSRHLSHLRIALPTLLLCANHFIQSVRGINMLNNIEW